MKVMPPGVFLILEAIRLPENMHGEVIETDYYISKCSAPYNIVYLLTLGPHNIKGYPITSN